MTRKGTDIKTLYYILTAMRPKQWTKNSFVFAGLIFARAFIEIEPVLRTIAAFLLFCAVSGSVYLINDVIDRERDALHPKKCHRPVASGKLRPRTATAWAVAVFAVSIALAWMLDFGFFIVLALYFLLTLLYSIKLKQVIILDVLLIASGFVLRTVGGALAIHVEISPWLIVCSTLLSLFLALNKRKNELLTLSADAGRHRKILDEYTPELIDQMLSVTTSATVMSYMLYTFTAGKSHYMMLTIPFVLYGIFRYQYLVSTRDMGGNPELVLLQDKPLLVSILLWVATSVVIVWLFY